MAGFTRLSCAALALLMLLTMTADDAEARRRAKFFAIPGGGASDTLVKVKDLPDRAPFIAKDGSFIDLGYRFTSYGSGEWIGYIGSSRKYLKLQPGGAEMLAMAAGLEGLPPVPERPAGSQFWLVMFGIGCLVIGWKIVKAIMRTAGAATGQATRIASRAGHASSNRSESNADWTRKADVAMRRPGTMATTSAGTSRAKRMASMTPGASMATPRASGGFGQRATFGRR